MDTNNIISLVVNIITALGILTSWYFISRQKAKDRESAAIAYDKLITTVANMGVTIDKQSVMNEAMREKYNIEAVGNAAKHESILSEVNNVKTDIDNLRGDHDKLEQKLEKNYERMNERIDEVNRIVNKAMGEFNTAMNELTRSIKELLQYRKEQK